MQHHHRITCAKILQVILITIPKNEVMSFQFKIKQQLTHETLPHKRDHSEYTA